MPCIEELIKELSKKKPIVFEDNMYFDGCLDPAWRVIQDVIDRLPNVFKDDFDWMEIEIATNGDELLFKYESDCELFANILDKHVFGFNECHTGYYDPYEDAKSGETDANSGWYYIDWD